MKDKYYLRALRFLEAQAYEEALTAFLRGVDHHSPKCAFGVFRTVTLHGSFTLCAEEARAI